jgi:hypothetical protein
MSNRRPPQMRLRSIQPVASLSTAGSSESQWGRLRSYAAARRSPRARRQRQPARLVCPPSRLTAAGRQPGHHPRRRHHGPQRRRLPAHHRRPTRPYHPRRNPPPPRPRLGQKRAFTEHAGALRVSPVSPRFACRFPRSAGAVPHARRAARSAAPCAPSTVTRSPRCRLRQFAEKIEGAGAPETANSMTERYRRPATGYAISALCAPVPAS